VDGLEPVVGVQAASISVSAAASSARLGSRR